MTIAAVVERLESRTTVLTVKVYDALDDVLFKQPVNCKAMITHIKHILIRRRPGENIS